MSENYYMEQAELDKLNDKYGVLLRNLQKYFPTGDDPEDRSSEFIKEYRISGENNIRFAGIEEQLKLAIKRDVEFSRLLNTTMGYDLSPEQTNEYMIDLYNRLTETDELRDKAAKDPDALMSYYALRPISLPFNVPYFGRYVPLWVVLVASVVVAGIGWFGFTYLNFPVIGTIFLGVLILGALGMAGSSLVMFFLRDEAVNSEKYRERQLAIKEYRESRQQKKSAPKWRRG